eukprot:6211028-Pleurochrysis_carterae.AAC.2
MSGGLSRRLSAFAKIKEREMVQWTEAGVRRQCAHARTRAQHGRNRWTERKRDGIRRACEEARN